MGHRINDKLEEIVQIEKFFEELSPSGKGKRGYPSDKRIEKRPKKRKCWDINNIVQPYYHLSLRGSALVIPSPQL
jgi:hypothetical protein